MVLGRFSVFYALSGGFIAFTGISSVPVHVDLGQCKLIRNAGKNGKRVGECFRFSKRREWDYEQTDHIVYPVDIRLHGPQGQRRRGVYQWRVRTTELGRLSVFYALSGGFIAFTGIS